MAELISDQGRRLAYHLTPGAGPTVVFLGGLRSDMTGTKAVHLEHWCKARGRAFLRFDYSGHGESGGAFEQGTIGQWQEDVQAVLGLVPGPVVLVGSSMGGWQALLATRAAPERVVGLVTIAGAPDFTPLKFEHWTPEQRAALERDGYVAEPSEYGEPMVYTRALIEDGADQLVLVDPLVMRCPVRILQGAADDVVVPSVAKALIDHMEGDDIQLVLVKGADHRFSDGPCLAVIERAVEDVLPAL